MCTGSISVEGGGRSVEGRGTSVVRGSLPMLPHTARRE